MTLDDAIKNYRAKAAAHAVNKAAFEEISQKFFSSHKELMFAKDALRDAERDENEVKNIQPIPPNAISI